MHRSTKKQFKPVEKKTEILDEQTRDEKEYLGPELFAILQEVKLKIESGELDEDAEEAEKRYQALKKQQLAIQNQNQEDFDQQNNENQDHQVKEIAEGNPKE